MQDQQQSQDLCQHIERMIAQAGGQISFADFMQAALYTPELGYYGSSLSKIGVDGDFITAPEMGPLFAQCLANQCRQIFAELSAPSIIEFGAGSGQLAIDLLLALEQLNCLPRKYFILEVSGHLRARQQAAIEQAIPELANRVHWLDSLPDTAIDAVIICNEVLDAMAVERFRIDGETIEQAYVSLGDNGLTQHYGATSNPDLLPAVAALPCIGAQDYCSEINLQLGPWLAACHQMLSRGVMLLIDYGFTQSEYYHPARRQGTLMCHYRHQSHPDPFFNLGLQDITAHVDFSRVAHLAHDLGWSVRGYSNQANFLLANDLLTWAGQATSDSRVQFKLNQAIKTLTLPHEMGELFKVMALGKDCDLALQGFQLRDMRVTL